MKLYLLIADKGSYEDNVTFTIGIFDSLEKAEEGKLTFLTKSNEIKKEMPEFPSEELYDNNPNLYDEMYDKRLFWEDKYAKYCDINNVYIYDFTLNKLIE